MQGATKSKTPKLQPLRPEMGNSSRKHLRDSRIPEEVYERASKSSQQTNVDLGHGLLTSILVDRPHDGSQIWYSLCMSQTENPFSNLTIASPAFPKTFRRAQVLDSTFPPLKEAVRLVKVGFNTCYRLHETIDSKAMLEAVDKLYNTTKEEENFPYLDYFTLLAAVLALAHALDAEGHRSGGCESAVKQGFVLVWYLYGT